MDKYIINGGEKLYGTVRTHSAKNTVLPLLAASILTDESRVVVPPRILSSFFSSGFITMPLSCRVLPPRPALHKYLM